MATTSLQALNIILGITGGIAAYKSAELTRQLKARGAHVKVVMTQSAQAFITPLTLQAVSGEPVHTELLNPEAEAGMGHIELAKWADVILIAPCTANTMAKLAHGLADDLLTTLHLASSAKLVIAPAMNQAMWAHPQTQNNTQSLVQIGATLLGPGIGEQACGDVGAGRMLEPVDIVTELEQLIDAPEQRIDAPEQTSQSSNQQLSGHRVLITAGPTREAIDPVRYITNHSSGKMGYALAQAAAQAGAKVTLISGPVNLATPKGVERIDVTSAQEMYEAVQKSAEASSIFIATAAVADYRPVNQADQKLKKQGDNGMTIEMTQNPDIVASVAEREHKPFTVGFAAETQDVIHYAKDKLSRKNLDMIIANDVSDTSIGFNSNENAVTVIRQNDEGKIVETSLDQASKLVLASAIISIISEQCD